MNVLVLGATGSVGGHLVRQGLARGHRITVLVRSPEKMRAFEGRLTILQGDVLDRHAVEKAVAGQEAVIYSVGVSTISPTTLFSQSTKILLEAMVGNGVKRLICITGVGAGETRGHGGFFYDRIIFPLFTKHRYQDKDRQEELIRNSTLDWIIVRPAPFHEGESSGTLQAVTEVHGVTLRRITRAEVATFALDQLTDNRFLRNAPFIGHAH